jgi:pimeloyl-ACP methyl ester carboxylesterase
MAVAGLFLVEFLSAGERPALSRMTATPSVSTLPVEGARVDRYVTPGPDTATPLVLVHGFTPDGKDDPRVREAARLLARIGFDVAVPTLPELTRARLREEDVGAVVATIAARPGPTVVIGVSVGAGLALLAAAEPKVRDRVRLVVSLGGYASAAELIRFYLTGEYRFGRDSGRVPHDPELVRMFVSANRDLLDASVAPLLSARGSDAVSAALARLSPALTRLLDTLSPEHVARDIQARLVLVHGRSDPAVPYTETLRLAAARPERTRVVLVGVVRHVEGNPATRWKNARDLVALWSVVYLLVRS